MATQSLSSAMLMAGASAAYVTYYMTYMAKKPYIVAGRGDVIQKYLGWSKVIHDTYYPALWCFGSHVMTLANVLRSERPVVYRREMLTAKDGGLIGIDWDDNEDSPLPSNTRPIVIILHGLTGGSNCRNVRSFVCEAKALGFRAVAMNYRGCNNTEVTTSRLYCAGWTEDVRMMTNHVASLYPDAPLLMVGISLGSIIMVKYLAEEGEKAPIRGAMSISNPFNMAKAMRNLERPINFILYNQYLARRLKNIMLPKLNEVAPNGPVDLKKAKKIIGLRDIDRHVVSPLFGYKDEEDYYAQCSSAKHIRSVEVPLLCLNAADDPFCPMEGVPVKEIEANPNALLVLTSSGGHVSFLERSLTRTYMDRVFKDWMIFLAHSREECA